MLYFFIAVFVGVFVAEDFRSGYAKNIFTVRVQKGNYVISKTVVKPVDLDELFLRIGASVYLFQSLFIEQIVTVCKNVENSENVLTIRTKNCIILLLRDL